MPSRIVTLKRRLESDGDLKGLSSDLCGSVRSDAMEKVGEAGRMLSGLPLSESKTLKRKS